MSNWIPVQARNVKPGDIVRVREKAYDGRLGQIHNGRICEVLQVKSGDVIVKSIDEKNPPLSATYYPPTALEKEVANETVN